MEFDFKPFFERYEALVRQVDTLFQQIDQEHPGCVRCRAACSDCCHAVFDLTLIEALYINRRFYEAFRGKEREAILDKANQADRQVYKFKRGAFKALRSGEKTEDRILSEMAEKRIRCPLLNDHAMCDLYGFRPITCRLYGIPTAIGGKGHTCGISGFKEGTAYPTINLDAIHRRLIEISKDLVVALKSKYGRMGEMLVPLSMALLNQYDERYLGVAEDDTDTNTAKE
jgi:Fe-S-cluster containining protein